MMVGTLIFSLKETCISICRSSLMNVIAVATVTITLILLGLFLLISLNLKKITDDIVSQLEVRIFLKSNLVLDDIQSFRQRLRSINGVKSVEFLDRSTAWKSFKVKYHHLDVGNYSDKSPLPNALILKLDTAQSIRPIIIYLKRFDTMIDDIVYGGELADRVDIFRRFMSISGIGLIGLLIIASIFIIINTIRLTVIARNEEITIMRLVGATDRFIKIPFLFEGLFIGLIGSICAVIFIAGLYAVFVSKLALKMPFFSFITDHFYLKYVYIFVVLTGVLIGVFGAYISVSRSLKVR